MNELDVPSPITGSSSPEEGIIRVIMLPEAALAVLDRPAAAAAAVPIEKARLEILARERVVMKFVHLGKR